jgi:filamentous hemagglutinin family protein
MTKLGLNPSVIAPSPAPPCTQSLIGAYLAIGCGISWLGVQALAPQSAIAQVNSSGITSDGSLGTLVNGSAVDSCLAAVCTITGGTLNSAQTTLLHSLGQFSLTAPGQSALFIDPGVNDIVVRVTGGARSLIDGTIRASAGSSANLFLVNSSGISFGPNAQLDLGGAFTASTASDILFANGIGLASDEATAPTASLLTVSAPVGLGFLADEAAADIEVQGSGHRLTFGSPDIPDSQFVNRIFQSSAGPFGPLPPISELAVRPNQSIALVANGIGLRGGNLTAAGGQVGLVSVSDGTVLFNAGGSLDVQSVETFADIAIAERSLLEVSADSPGQLFLRGQNISVSDSSALLAETLPTALLAAPITRGLIDIQATETVSVSGFTAIPEFPFNPPFHTYLSVDVAPGATGVGGKIDLRSRHLTVADGGQLGANTYGIGDAGQLQVAVEDTVTLTGGSFLGPSGLFAISGLPGDGSGGQLSIRAENLLIERGAQAFTSSFNSGAAGNIQIDVSRVALLGTSEPITIFNPDGTAQTVVIPTLLQTGMGEASLGQGGDLTINADQIRVAGGATITTGTFGPGNAGAISLVADEITVDGFSAAAGPSGIFATVGPGATGNGGSLNIDTRQLRVLNGAQIATSTAGPGNAGDLVVTGESVLLSGQVPQGRSGLFATAIGSVGTGGNLFVTANDLQLREGATLSVSNFPSSADSPIPPGQGAAGNLQVSARQITLRDQSLLSADTAVGDRGNINLETVALTLRQGSRITTNATGTATGGNIDIDAMDGFVVAVPTENSDITANAVFGDGGNVSIAAQNVLGIEPRESPTALSDITASSEFGVAGETRIETLDPDLRPQAEPLPQSTEVSAVAQGCAPSGSSRFVSSGQGGLSAGPYGVLNSRDSLADVSLPGSLAAAPGAAVSAAPNESAAAPPVEAQGWTMSEQGVVLLAADSAADGRCLSWQQ